MTTTINLAGLATASKTKKKEKPILDADPALVDAFRKHKDEYKKAEGAFEASKTHLLMATADAFFRLNTSLALQGREPVSTAEMLGDTGTARITMTSRYSLCTAEDLTQNGYAQLIEQGHFIQRFDIKVDGDQIPLAHRQEFVDGLKSLVEKCGASAAVSVTSGYAPVPAFHSDRWRLMTPEANLSLQGISKATLYVA